MKFAPLPKVLGLVLCSLWLSFAPASAVGVPPAARPAPVAGAIAGQITDAATGEPLPGATAQIQGTALGTAAGLDGRYRIAGVPNGPQVIVVSYVGYRSAEVPITVENGQTLSLDVELDLDVVEGEEVLITALAEGQVSAINQQLSSNTIVNVVSAARIQELPDVNAAEVVGRLPGISLKRTGGEGQKVVVRGLSPKYNAVTIDGAPMPSTDLNDRSVDLSMITPEMLDGIEVYKSLRPDQDADAIGGRINFRLREAPCGFRSNVSAQGGYNGLSNSLQQYKVVGSASDCVLGNRIGVFVQANVEQADRSSDILSAGYDLRGEKQPDQEFAPVFIERADLADRDEVRDRLGGSTTLTFRMPNGHIKASGLFNRLDRNVLTRENRFDNSDRAVLYTARDQDITLDVFQFALSGDHSLGRLQADWRLNRSVSLQRQPYDVEFEFRESAAFDFLGLREDAGPGPLLAAARNNFADARFDRGDIFTRRMEEVDLGAEANAQLAFSAGRRLAGYLKAGGKYKGKTRVNDEDRWIEFFYFGDGMSQLFSIYPNLTPTPTGEAALSNWLDEDHDPGDDFLGGQYELGATIDFDEMREIAEVVDFERSLFSDLGDFDTEEDISAGYGMAELNFGRALMLMGGLRYEHTDTFFRAFNGVVGDERNTDGAVFDTTSSQSYNHWFPMVHLRYRPVSWFDIRLAYTQTLSRPDFQFISPRSRIRDTSRRIDRGTPGLRPAESTNYDVFLSFNGNKLGLFTVGGFLKKIDGVIYTRTITVLDPEALMLPRRTQGYRLTDPINHPETTTVRGFEVEWQANFLYLPRPFDGIVLNANYARIFSETGFVQVNLIRRTEPPFGFENQELIRESRMPDQSNDIANISLGYERGGFSGRISMLYQGNTLSRVGGRPETDGLTEALMRWDAQIQQRVFQNLNLFLQLNNITNRRDASEQATFGFPTDQEYYGLTAALGVRFRTR